MKNTKLSRNGANLAEDKKNKLREIDKELSRQVNLAKMY
jgi:peptidyl-dipeptidase Dcp